MKNPPSCQGRVALGITLLFSLLFSASAMTAETSETDVAVATEANATGEVVELRGTAWAISADNTKRQLAKGDETYQNELYKTGASSLLSIRLKDSTFFAIGADSEMRLERFSYRQADAEDGLASRIIKGTFRFISGLIAKQKPKSMVVRAGGVATIGIRGTHVSGEIIPREMNGDKVTTEESAKITLLEPEDKNQKTSIEVYNNYGSVVIDQPGFGTEIPDEHSPPSPIRKMQIRTINRINRALRK